MANDSRVIINTSLDIVTAREQARAMAQRLGFRGSEATLITAATSEIARNILDHASNGVINLGVVQNGTRRGIKIVARDRGPGIANLAQAMQYGFSTRKRPGVGLPGAKWLMDEFRIQSKVGKGTTVTMKKWAGHLGHQE